MLESTGFTNSFLSFLVNIACASACKLKAVKNLLTCCFYFTEDVSERMNIDNISVCDVTKRKVSTDTTTVNHSDIRLSNCTISIGTKVTNSCLAVSYHSYACAVRNLKSNVTLCHNFHNFCFIRSFNTVKKKREQLLLPPARGICKVWRWWHGCSEAEKAAYRGRIVELSGFARDTFPRFGRRGWPLFLRASAPFLRSTGPLTFAGLYYMNRAYCRLKRGKREGLGERRDYEES